MGSIRVRPRVTSWLQLRPSWLLCILFNSPLFALGAFVLPGPHTVFKTECDVDPRASNELSSLSSVLLTAEGWSVAAMRDSCSVRLSRREDQPYLPEPLFQPIKIDIKYHTQNRSLIEPGYIFIAPHLRNHGWGPHIFDQEGDLVWYGQDTVSDIRGRRAYAMNFHVCDYLGESGTHLCYSEARPDGRDDGIRSSGTNRIFTSAYEQIGPDYQIASDFTPPNPHEFHMFPGGESFAQAVYKLRKYDLRPYKGEKEGYIYEGCFQEVDVRTTEEIFRWCVLDEQPIWHTNIYLHVPDNRRNLSTPIGGKGTEDEPWDFMHLNAVDKNEEGDYIVSGRHLDQVTKIAGLNNRHGLKPGKTIWKVGGKASDIKQGKTARFTRQHDCRFIKTTENETIISVFDNAWEGHTKPSAPESSAKIITINNRTQVATAKVYKHPENQLSYAHGSTQVLSNGNVYVGWGSLPEWSEFSNNGTLLSYAHAVADTDHLENYRTHKFPWVGHPNTRPKLILYSRQCRITPKNHTRSPLVAYASWNGATEVVSWRVKLGSTQKGPWVGSGSYPRKGFETKIYVDALGMTQHVSLVRYAYIEALDHRGVRLGRSEIVPTFVPNVELRNKCDAEGCSHNKPFEYAEDQSRAELCGASWGDQAHAIISLWLICMAFEFVDYYLMQRVLRQKLAHPSRPRRKLPPKFTHET